MSFLFMICLVSMKPFTNFAQTNAVFLHSKANHFEDFIENIFKIKYYCKYLLGTAGCKEQMPASTWAKICWLFVVIKLGMI